ncbi:23S rRNA (guanosine2251-2'-O)-methyltransferase [Ruaniaceae bacterium KH17]|nr:23S rRNA (guanosine2251-2'-O)-methyltransferase [Ruaniaceae bacterium KH17]
MAGNSQRKGAVRKGGSRQKVGSGGQRRRGLEGKGPTPKAEDRTYHAAHKRKQESDRREAAAPKRRTPGWVKALPRDTEFVVGRNAVTEAVGAGIPILGVYAAGGLSGDERVSEVLRAATESGAPLYEVTRGELEAISAGQSHQGIAIAVPPHEYADLDDLVARASEKLTLPLFVALDGVTDPHNLGAVIRSAGAFGADGVIIPERRAAGVTASVWKVSAGALAHVEVARVTNLVRALTDLKTQGYFVVGLDGVGAIDIGTLELYDQPLVLVTGAEGAGLSRLVRETCDVTAAIPISANVESLNAAVATGICLYQVTQLREKK